MFDTIELAQTRYVDGTAFPLTLGLSAKCESLQDVLNWFSENKEVVDSKLRKHKALLFRCGKFVNCHQDFNAVVASLNYNGMDYIGGAAVRTQLTERVFTANESPSTELIPFHHEMAQTPSPPTHLFFYCETPPESGGETPILVSAEVCSTLEQLQPKFMDELERKGVQYVRYMSEFDDPTSAIGRGWRSTFLTNDRAGAEAALLELGSSWEWQGDGTLKTVTATVAAIRTDDQPAGAARTHQKTFFNSVVAAYTGWNDSRNEGTRAVLLGGAGAGAGEESRLLDVAAMATAVQVMDEVCVAFPWKAGDVLLLDNRTVMHSRRPFEGQRRILASLARDPWR